MHGEFVNFKTWISQTDFHLFQTLSGSEDYNVHISSSGSWQSEMSSSSPSDRSSPSSSGSSSSGSGAAPATPETQHKEDEVTGDDDVEIHLNLICFRTMK